MMIKVSYYIHSGVFHLIDEINCFHDSQKEHLSNFGHSFEGYYFEATQTREKALPKSLRST
jgi:hypothetical protein